MAQATRGTALFSVGWTFIQLGRLEQGCDAGLEAVRCARISGSQPEFGEAARVAAYGCIHARRVLDAASLFGELQEFHGDRTLPMLIARDVLLRSVFLHLNGRIDDALACIAATRGACSRHPVYETYCDVAELRALLYASRFDELLALCVRLRGSARVAAHPRLEPWIERVEALADHLAFGRTEQAIARLDRAVDRLPQCEPQALMALDLSWLQLERGAPALAEPLLRPLQNWIEQSAPGRLVRARLHYERGRFEAAAFEQRRFVERYGATLTPFVGSLVDVYEQAARSGRRQTIKPIDQPLDFQYGLAPSVVQQLPAELGGPNAARPAQP